MWNVWKGGKVISSHRRKWQALRMQRRNPGVQIFPEKPQPVPTFDVGGIIDAYIGKSGTNADK